MAEEPKKDEILNATKDLLEQLKFKLDVDGRPVVRVLETLSFKDLLNLGTIVGFTSGETFDDVQGELNGSGNLILSFNNGGECEFQLVLRLTSSLDFGVTKRGCVFNLVQQNGDRILQQNGDGLLAQGAI